MSRITVTIDRIAMKGFDASDRNAIVQALRTELERTLADPAGRAEWAQSHRTPVLRLGRLPMESSAGGARRFGGLAARAIAKGLKA